MKRALLTTVYTVIAGGLLWTGAATAQTPGAMPATASDAAVNMFTRNRNISVQQRERPDYEALGIRLGSFLAFPKAQLQVEQNDNVYAASDGTQSDTIWRVIPEIALESDWSQHYLSVYARGNLSRYSDFSTEDTDEYGFGASGQLDVTRLSSLAASADYLNTFEPRTSPNSPDAAVSPINYSIASANVSGSYTGGRTRVSGRADIRKFDYEDGLDPLGGSIDQDTRDRSVTSLMGRVDYAISPDTAFFVQATGNTREYDFATVANPARDSSGAEILAGANFELSALVRGEVAVGYIAQDFDADTYSDTSSFSGRGQVEWFPTQLTTVTLAVGRTVEDAVNPGVGGFIMTSTSVTVDHELLRNVILSGRLSYSDESYEGIDRDDGRFGATVSVNYLINRNVGVNVAASTLDLSSDGAARDSDYSVNRLSVSLVTQF